MTGLDPLLAPAAARRWALFLDVDGTLLDIAPRPDAVIVPPGLLEALEACRAQLDGALAIVTGRALADVDRLLHPHRFCAAGQHGAELRDVAGRDDLPRMAPGLLDQAQARLEALAENEPGVVIEPKGHGIAVHFRLRPQAEGRVLKAVAAEIDRLGPGWRVMPGKMIYEIKSTAHSKGTAVAWFMDRPPFAGRTPVFFGDDVTDEDGFAAAARQGGFGVRIGAAASGHARATLPDAAAVRAWLAALATCTTDGTRLRA